MVDETKLVDMIVSVDNPDEVWEMAVWLDIEFTLLFSMANDAVMNYRVYDIAGRSGEPDYTTPCYTKLNKKYSEETTEDISEAEVFADGYLKWDGCGSFNLHDNHICGRETAVRFGPLMERLYDMGKKMMSNWDGDH